jgi:hypothetical protein
MRGRKDTRVSATGSSRFERRDEPVVVGFVAHGFHTMNLLPERGLSNSKLARQYRFARAKCNGTAGRLS